jgi:VanZ family protein
MASPEERTNLFEYSIVALLIYEALTERAIHGNHVPLPALLAILIAALFGCVDEGIQALLPNRDYDIRDVGYNAPSAMMAIAASLTLS